MTGYEPEYYLVCIQKEDGRLQRASGNYDSEQKAIATKENMVNFGCKLPFVVCSYRHYVENMADSM